MGRSKKTIERMDKRVDELIQSFDDYWKHYDNNPIFSGPSTYFHHRTISLLKKDGLTNVLSNDEYFEYLYATLASWGLHRMGDTNTKLLGFGQFKNSIKSQKEDILALKDKKITQLKRNHKVKSKLQTIIENINIGHGKIKVIFNSKALHHILPDLVPPIDRRYTLLFFYNNRRPPNVDDTFKEIYPKFVQIATNQKDTIYDKIGDGFNTSETKVIDNAIMGYVKKKGLK